MSYSISFEEREKYLYAKVTGTNSVETVQAYVNGVFRTCQERGFRAVLIEENLSGPGLRLTDIYRLVTGASQRLLDMPWTAHVDTNPEHSAENMLFAENVGVNRGIKLRSFPDIKSAEEWLDSI